jgi:hypothetical protein
MKPRHQPPTAGQVYAARLEAQRTAMRLALAAYARILHRVPPSALTEAVVKHQAAVAELNRLSLAVRVRPSPAPAPRRKPAPRAPAARNPAARLVTFPR